MNEELSLKTKTLKESNRKKVLFLIISLVVTFLVTISVLFVGSSNMPFLEAIKALFHKSSDMNNRIIWNIRIPRILAAIIAGSGLSLAGLMMQSNLHNDIASPSTIGVSSASVLGANIGIIVLGGGLSIGTGTEFGKGSNPYITSLFAFLFAMISIFILLGLSSAKKWRVSFIVLVGVALSSIWAALTTLIQYFATESGLASAVIWTFGDLGRATYKEDLIMAIVVILSAVFFEVYSNKYNAILSGDNNASSLGVNVKALRVTSLILAGLITATCVAFLGTIAFVGVIIPHIIKRILGNDHKFVIPASMIGGALLLVLADTLSRGVANGTTFPVGAITSLLGAPFFVALIFKRREND